MPESVAPEIPKQVRQYDFQSHEAMDRSRLRRVLPVLEVAAHRVTQALAGVVRAPVRVEIGELEQKRWEVFANSLPEPSFLAFSTVHPFGGRVVLHVPLPLAATIVELRLGGAVTGVELARPLSDIELRLFMEAAEAVVTEVFEALKAVVPMSVGGLTASSSPVLVQVPNPAEICLLVNLKFSIGDSYEASAVLCVPLSILLALLDALERVDMTQPGESDSVVHQVRERLFEAPVEVQVSLAEIVLSADELLSLTVGDVIPLHQPEGLALRLNVGDVHYCDVVPTSKGKRLACMVVESKPEEK